MYRRAKLLEGKLHTADPDNLRVSILYKGIGLYTYKLEERTNLTEFKTWSGTIGNVKYEFLLKKENETLHIRELFIDEDRIDSFEPIKI